MKIINSVRRYGPKLAIVAAAASLPALAMADGPVTIDTSATTAQIAAGVVAMVAIATAVLGAIAVAFGFKLTRKGF